MELDVDKLDVIMSDMAPNTIWVKDIDAIRSINLLEKCVPIYQKFLSLNGKIIIKIFMWPWFDEFVNQLKEIYTPQKIKIFKPKSCRNASKETYIIKM
jgi:23S rRNA (uridine2552-2'-O)-methyltransferase